MMMMMEEEGEESEIEHVFVAHEIDLDYEFDAARFFDFTRPETPHEAHNAELWFHNAATYPPSPFVTRLPVREDLVLDDVEDSPKSNHLEECTSNVEDGESGVPLEMEFSDNNNGSEALGGKISGLLAGILQNDGMRPLQVPNGLTFDSKTTSESLNSKAKSAVPKSSTLMKPTASQLAKKNHCVKNNGSRFQKLLNQNTSSLSISSGIESQAPKRQKLEGGLLRKVADVKPQTTFVHKTSMKAVTVEQNSACSKLKLTIPREPDLKTAHRARRIRPKDAEAEHSTVASPRFKARPLNRRILDGPSLPLPKRSTPRLPEFQEFHLKTSERATQHTPASTSSSLHCNDYNQGWDKLTTVSAVEHRSKDLKRPTAIGAPKCDGLGFTHVFKAQPLNKKMLSIKRDIGVGRSNKQEKTVSMEFDLNTEKVAQHNPPIELFSKLSLTSEGQLNNGSHFKLPQHSGMCRKEKAFIFVTKQVHPGNGGCISLMSARRSLGIR